MRIEIRQDPLDPWAAVALHQASMELAGQFGATAVFVGSMRDFNEGARVIAMTLEHYTAMAEKHLALIAEQAMARWDILDVLIIHRVGDVYPNDPIVLVATWSAHRAAAYDANRFIMEDLKSKAPFWKKETLRDGSRWVEKNTPG
ncbi:MAG: molybdenum cofactor biosynthesis protein MoaE [Gammaproteobacteria bacterium]|nr:molybdenum cofactor biosynthesis protein MoaE [Gammaproteobacteria bacterium]MBA3731126.1 molybdenum cofactor biosynthesis protein MoaE [Gammaproteobacteria bacterium]